MIDGEEITLELAGVGIVFHSPSSTKHIVDGSDYLTSSFTTEQQVQSHIQKGDIVGFATGSPGTFVLRFHSGYPNDDVINLSDFKLRQGLKCVDGLVFFEIYTNC